MSASAARRRGIPDATVARLPDYLRILTGLAAREIESTSSGELAAATGVTSAKVRKDLSHLGTYGVRGVGYDVDHLAFQIARELGLTQEWPVVIVGMGNLGRALAAYGGFSSRGFQVVALLDHDPAIVGTLAGGHHVVPMTQLPAIGATSDSLLGVIATPAASAQVVADALIAAGITSILNFAACPLAVSPGVDVRKVDVSTELQILAYHKQRRTADESAWAEAAP